MCPAVFIIHLISVAFVLLVSNVMVQFSLPFNTAGRDSVLYSFILAVLKVLCSLNILLIIPAIFT